ncbi:hypothetical protein GCM10010160_37900 [Acrocarpospora corrugata]
MSLIGDLDLIGLGTLRAAVREVTTPDLGTWGKPRPAAKVPGHIYLDLAKVEFIDCAGARTLVWVAARMRGRVTILNPSPLVGRVLALLEFDRFLTIVERGDTLIGDVPHSTHASPEPFRRRDGSPSDDPVASDSGGSADREARPPRLAGPA